MDSEEPYIMFIFSVVDYGFFTYNEAVRYILISKICFCVFMVQIADHNYHFFRCFIFLQDLKVFFNSVRVISVTIFGYQNLSLECKPSML